MWDKWDKVIENRRPIRPPGLNRPIYPSRQVKDIVTLSKGLIHREPGGVTGMTSLAFALIQRDLYAPVMSDGRRRTNADSVFPRVLYVFHGQNSVLFHIAILALLSVKAPN